MRVGVDDCHGAGGGAVLRPCHTRRSSPRGPPGRVLKLQIQTGPERVSGFSSDPPAPREVSTHLGWGSKAVQRATLLLGLGCLLLSPAPKLCSDVSVSARPPDPPVDQGVPRGAGPSCRRRLVCGVGEQWEGGT